MKYVTKLAHSVIDISGVLRNSILKPRMNAKLKGMHQWKVVGFNFDMFKIGLSTQPV
jgi:hypothetical protein